VARGSGSKTRLPAIASASIITSVQWKERKKAREAEKAGGAGRAVPAIRYTITLKEFTDAADWIANLTPVKVLCSLLALFAAVVVACLL
jgi:hypothetical protein